MIGKWLLRLLVSLFCIVIAIYFLVWLFSPILVRHFGNDSLRSFDLALSKDSSVRYNPFLSRLSIDTLSLYKQEKQVFAIANGELEIDLHKLLWGKAYLKILDIKGLRLAIAEEADGFLIAGFYVGNDQTTEQQQLLEENMAAGQHAAPLILPYRLFASLLTVEDAIILFKNNQTEHLVEIKKFSIKGLDVDQFQQQAKIELLVNIARGSLALDSRLNINNGSGELISEIKLNKISVGEFNAYLPQATIKPIKSIEGLFSVDFNTKIAIEADSSTDAINGSPPDLSKLMPTSIRVDGEMALDKLKVLSSNEEQVLTQWDSLTVKGIHTGLSFADVEQTLKFGIKSITLNKISSSDASPQNTDLPPLSTIDKLQASGLNLEKHNLTIDNITVNGMHNHIIVGQDKVVKTLVTLDEPEQIAGEEMKTVGLVPPEDQSNNGSQEPLHFAIKALVFSGENTLYFRDESVQPVYERILHIDKMKATNINSRTTERTDFSLAGSSNTYAKIGLSGYVYPFSDKINFRLEGDIKEVTLPPVSSYLRENLGFGLRSGDLDLMIDVTVTESQLNGNTRLSIRGLETSNPETVDTNVLQKTTPLSLNAALNFLKDKRGNITLDVPMTGSVDDPGFGINSVIQLIAKRAAVVQVRRYMLTFVPYADVVTIAMKAGEMVLRVRFEDLIYAPGQVALEKQQLAYAKQFIALMEAKPKVQVKVCGFAVATDLMKKNDGKQLAFTTLTPEQTTYLRAVAQQRSENFKANVVKKGKVEPSRVLICNPQIDLKKDAQPRIEIGI